MSRFRESQYKDRMERFHVYAFTERVSFSSSLQVSHRKTSQVNYHLRVPAFWQERQRRIISQSALRCVPMMQFPCLFYAPERSPAITPLPHAERSCPRLPLRLLLGLLHDLLDNLLLLDQEGAGDTVLDAVGAARSTVGTLDGLLGPRDGGVFAWAQGWDLYEENLSVA